MKILITGSTGYIGRRLVYEFMNSDTDVRLLVRNKQKLDRIMQENCEVVEGSTFDSIALHDALEGVDCAYYLIHSMGKGADFEDIDRKSAEAFREACIEKRCKKGSSIWVVSVTAALPASIWRAGWRQGRYSLLTPTRSTQSSSERE